MQSYPDPIADGGAPYYGQPASQQQQPSGLSNPAELQLTAQLSRGLAPIMNAAQGGGMQEGQDPRGSVPLQYHHEHSQQHAHMQAGGQGQMDSMAAQFAASPPTDASNRKRSKVSRACDECRRKKIRCDATDEAGDQQQCSSCKRVGARCLFSRVPMKRGPSKGYIKELADRVQNLEQSQQAGDLPLPGQQYLHHDSPQQRRASEEFSPPEADAIGRKRTYSSVSGADFGAPYVPQRPPQGWASQELPRNLPLPHPSTSFAAPHSAPATATTMFREPNYSPNGLQPTPQWRVAPEPPRRQSSSFESLPQTDHGHPERAADFDESIVEGYYNFIHPTYPLLALSKTKIRAMADNCPTALREAFYEALYAAVRSFPIPNAPTPEQQSSRKASQLILASQYENSGNRTMATNLIHLQTMLLMAIEADNRDPRGQVGVPQSVWLGSAVGLAYSMKLYAQKVPSQQSETDPDSDERLARRLWWSLVIMDRWRAASLSCPLQIPDTSVVVSQDDQALLGESLYHLTRLSIVLGHFTLIPTDLPALTALTAATVPVLNTLVRGELERLRESLPGSSFPPPNESVMYLSYWYLRILLAVRLPELGPQDLCDAAVKIVTQLTNNTSLISPLTHHATAFAAVALIECTWHEQTRKEAEGSLTALLESRIAPSGWDASIRDMIMKNKNPGQSSGAGSAVGAKAGISPNAANLQHLAELATASTGGEAENPTTEGRKESSTGGQALQQLQNLREMVRVGYWAKVGGGEAGR